MMEQALPLFLLLLASTTVAINVSSININTEFEYCETTVKNWASSSLHSQFKEDKNILRDLLFFLHVPRTGGRTYFHCFLRKLYANSLECPQSYDKLRYDPSKSNCMLLANHDDYSIITKLPQERTSVVTILRNPIDRVFSTYEFSIEVAARFLVHPNMAVTRMSKRIPGNNSTLDIWPWKYLVPWMREDLFARRGARRKRGLSNANSNDSYNMEEFIMPLHDYIIDPIALDIIHNGATFQIAGLTNNSYIGEAHDVRKCVVKYPILGKHVLDIAKKRLNDMLYVGLTEEHKESATMFANVVGVQVNSQLASKSVNPVVNKSEQSLSAETSPPQMTVEKLMTVYETCINGLRKTQSLHRADSLKKIASANFTKEARRHVSEETIKKITALNNLDVELYKYAQDHFARQQRILKQKLVDSGMQKSQFLNAYTTLSWEAVSFSLSTFLLLFLLLFVHVRRRASKLKI